MSRAELGRLVAYVFQASGRRRISEDDWVRLLSLERQWFPPSQARRLSQAARSVGLLRNAGEQDFEMGLEAEGLVLPFDYKPAAELASAAEVRPTGTVDASVPVFRRLVRHLAQALRRPESEVVRAVNQAQEAFGGLLRAEVAALYYGALHGVDTSAFFDDVDASLRPAARHAK